MAEQILKVKLVADVGQSEAALKLFTDSAKDAGVSIEKVFKAVNVETDKIAYDIKVTADELDKLDKAFKSAKAKFSEDKTTKLSGSFIEVTKNIDAEAARIAKSRQKGFEEDLAKRTTRLKESLSLELALIREGENSITAIKLESASKQRKLGEKLQEDLAVVKQKFIDQDITAATKNTSINKLYADYKDATVKLNELTDERIAKANQEVADFNLVEKKLAETSARRVKLVEDREKALTDIQIAAAKKSQEVQNALIKQTVDALIVTEDKEYKRLLAARKANAEAAFRAIPSLMEQLGASASYKPDEEKLKISKQFAALSLLGVQENLKIEAKLKDDALAAEEERLARIEFDTKASYNARQVMYAALMRQMDEDDAARAAKEKERLASISARAPQASRDDRGYVPFAMGTVGGNRAAAQASTAADQAVSASRTQILQEAETRAFLRRRASLDGEEKAVEATTRAYKSLGTHIAEVIGIYRIYNAAINLTEQALLSIPKALINLQSSTASLTATFGTAAAAARELEFLNEEGKRTGVSVNQLRKSYADFAASLLMAGESAETLRRVFSNVNTIATTLHMTTDAVDSTFLALAQSFNKGKIQAEEMVKQLAQRLPGIYNQAAVALGMTTRQLGEEMKKGLVEAHGNIDAIVALLAKTFGGEAFRKASTGLNAELGRLTGSWTLFAENVGKASEETMSNFVRNLTAVLDKLVKFTSSTQSLKGTLTDFFYILGGTAIGSLVAYTRNIILATTATEGAAAATLTLKGAWSTLGTTLKSNIFTIALTGLGLLIGKLIAAKESTFSLEDRITKVLEKSIALQGQSKAAYDASQNQEVKDAEELVKYQETKLTGLYNQQKLLEKQAENSKSDYFINKLNKINQEVFIGEAALKRLKAESARAYGEALVSPQETYKPSPVETTTSTTEQKKALTEAYKISLEEAKNAAKQVQSDIAEALGNIDILYQQNAMSIETYFSQKMQLQETDLAVQKEMLNQELQLAYAQKDKVKIQKLNGELIKAETDANKLATKTIIEKTNTERELQTSLANINAEYAKTFGTMVTATEAADAAEQKFLATNGASILELSLLADAGDELAAKRLKQLYTLKDSAVIDEQLNDLATKRNALAAEYDATLQRIADRTTAGFPDIWGTASDEALAKYKAGMVEIETKQQEILSSQGAVPSLSDNAKKEVAKTKEVLEDLKGKSGYIAEQMSKSFNDSFSNAFTGFIAGTDSASKAFSNFATSMIGSIQRILAQKMAETLLSSFITPALSSLGGSFMGLFGSSISGATAATMGTGPVLAAANGGVFSGPGISAYSGSIVSNPTIFPFAKGTGLMGEAGPEAILPLTRNSKGKLGVIADSTGQSGGNVYNIEVTVQSSKDEKPADTGQKIAEAMMRTIAKQEIGLAARPGNSLNRTTKFG
jgi:lambda family phage tail tape measure protein